MNKPHTPRIIPVAPGDKFVGMVFRIDVINGDPDDLVDIKWEYTIRFPRPHRVSGVIEDMSAFHLSQAE